MRMAFIVNLQELRYLDNLGTTNGWYVECWFRPDTNSSPLKIDGSKTIVIFWDAIFSGASC